MRLRSMVYSACALLLLSVLVAPVAAQTTPEGDVGFTRFAHTAVDVPPLDIYLGNNPQPVVTNLKYGDVTDFIALSTKLSGYTARAAGSAANSEPLFKLDWGVKANKSEMITAAGLGSRKAFVLEPLTLVRNDTKGKARVRVFNTVWGGPALNVTTTQGTAFGQNLEYLKVSNDADVAPGTYDFEVKDGTGKTVASTPGVNLEADKVYVMLLMGGAEGNPAVKLMPVVSDEEKTRVQFVNGSGGPVDVYIKGQDKPIALGLANGASSELSALPSGAVTFVTRNGGSALTDQELAFIATQLRPGRDTVITLTKTGGAVQMVVTSDLLTPMTNNAAATAQATMQATMQATAAK